MRARALLGPSLVLAVLAAPGCAGRARPEPAEPRSLRGGEGSLHVYLQPVGDRLRGLELDVTAVAAIDASGTARPLEVRLDRLGGARTERQRLLADGALAAGPYGSLEVALAAPRAVAVEPSVASVSFRVEAGAATVVTLRVEEPGGDGAAVPLALTAGPSVAAEVAPGATALAAAGSTLVVFHRRTGEVFDRIATAPGARGVAFDAERSLAYVASEDADVVEAYDLARRAREQSLPLRLGDRPASLALSSDGETVVVANPGSNTVVILDAPALAERHRVAVGQEPVAALLEPTERRAVVFQRGEDSVSFVDLERGAVVATVPTDDGPAFGAFSPDGRSLFVVHRDSPYLAAIDLRELRVVRRAWVGQGGVAIAADPRGRLYLARRGTGRIEVFDPSSLLPIASVELGGDATFLRVDADGERVLAAIPSRDEIRAVHLAGGATATSTDAGAPPTWIDVAGERRAP